MAVLWGTHVLGSVLYIETKQRNFQVIFNTRILNDANSPHHFNLILKLIFYLTFHKSAIKTISRI